jgi:carbon storage regulator
MLVLSRRKNESIVINNDITITVVEIHGDKVRLGIVAPKEVPVHRQEPSLAPVAGPSGAGLHPLAERMCEYAHFILGVGGRSPSSDFWEHVKTCVACRQDLKDAIAAVSIT